MNKLGRLWYKYNWLDSDDRYFLKMMKQSGQKAADDALLQIIKDKQDREESSRITKFCRIFVVPTAITMVLSKTFEGGIGFWWGWLIVFIIYLIGCFVGSRYIAPNKC